jgi:hypothetical protein
MEREVSSLAAAAVKSVVRSGDTEASGQIAGTAKRHRYFVAVGRGNDELGGAQ